MVPWLATFTLTPRAVLRGRTPGVTSQFDPPFDPIPVAIKGEVACLAVRDNRSVVVGLGEDKKVDDLGPFWLFVLFIDDNGEGQEPNDTFTYVLIGQPNPIPVSACNRNDLLDSLDEVHPFNVIEQGNFIVHDAMP